MTTEQQPAERRQEEPEKGGGSSLLRSGALMALGTIASRITGFVRSAVIIIALGNGILGSIYNLANTIPNIIYDLLFGGILSSIIVPMIVQAKRKDREYGERYEQRFFTAALLGLAVITIGAVVAAPLIMRAYGGSELQGADLRLAVLFAMFFLPQIFFYGVGAFAGAILNTRNSFAVPMWAPVLNNVVVIAVGVAFLVIQDGGPPTAANLTDAEFLLLAIGTTGGIVLQTIVLWPALRATGFRWRPRLDFQKGELGQVGKAAGWTLLYVVLIQVGFLIITRLNTTAGFQAEQEGLSGAYGYASYATAYQFFQLPYAIVAVSVITALLPRMSAHAADGDTSAVRDDFSSGLRLSSVLIVPGAAYMLALAPDIVQALFAHGNTSSSDAAVIGRIMQAFAIALIPFSIYQLMLRVFYAHRDTRTPALVAFVTVVVNVGTALAAFNLLPTEDKVVGIAGAFVITNCVGVVVCALLLRRLLGRIDAGRIIAAHVKMLAAAGPMAAFAVGCHILIEKWAGTGLIPSLTTLVVGGLGGGILYLVAARVLRIPEADTMVRTLSARIPGLR
ncbi:murein biosynthesis integral membrane protein MurJ [Actinocorallia sp. A-T 12471]|uniref:murein biosynthesis integral membrane protein MurJ n=1 Tax=Actinocorallia sp. A-T 12471 TaxID=3089813 RepID=UPI0029CCCF1D|nr:murein biosynthesis integral membrane protein MurJ [Actinocorallia sp. A-T 12471]MDX6742733.1 murein biosynthesis integral membrane protein MurJ [Actinocorallia sp. A-T 12471]